MDASGDALPFWLKLVCVVLVASAFLPAYVMEFGYADGCDGWLAMFHEQMREELLT